MCKPTGLDGQAENAYWSRCCARNLICTDDRHLACVLGTSQKPLHLACVSEKDSTVVINIGSKSYKYQYILLNFNHDYILKYPLTEATFNFWADVIICINYSQSRESVSYMITGLSSLIPGYLAGVSSARIPVHEPAHCTVPWGFIPMTSPAWLWLGAILMPGQWLGHNMTQSGMSVLVLCCSTQNIISPTELYLLLPVEVHTPCWYLIRCELKPV